MRVKTRVSVIVVILIVCLATSCMSGREEVVVIPSLPTNTPIPTVVEPGLAYGIPCKPPCWRGLIPGQSTRWDAAQAVEQLQAEGWADHVVDGSSIGGGYSISPSPLTSQGTIHITIEDDIVTRIRCSSPLLFYYPVGTLIEQSGIPEGLYLVSKGSARCSSCEGWEPPEPPTAPVRSFPVHLLYPSQGLWFLMLVPMSGGGCICPEMKVTAFCYYPPVSMQEALSNNYLAGLCTSVLDEITGEDLDEWHGFGGGY